MEMIYLAVLALAVFWAIFPFIVMSKFNELLKENRAMLKELKDSSAHLQAMRKYYERPEESSLR